MWIVPKNAGPTSRSAPDTGGSTLDSNSLASMLSERFMWRSKPSPSKTWSRRLKREPWLQDLCSRISGDFDLRTWLNETDRSSSAEDSHASQQERLSSPTVATSPSRMFELEIIPSRTTGGGDPSQPSCASPAHLWSELRGMGLRLSARPDIDSGPVVEEKTQGGSQQSILRGVSSIPIYPPNTGQTSAAKPCGYLVVTSPTDTPWSARGDRAEAEPCCASAKTRSESSATSLKDPIRMPHGQKSEPQSNTTSTGPGSTSSPEHSAGGRTTSECRDGLSASRRSKQGTFSTDTSRETGTERRIRGLRIPLAGASHTESQPSLTGQEELGLVLDTSEHQTPQSSKAGRSASGTITKSPSPTATVRVDVLAGDLGVLFVLSSQEDMRTFTTSLSMVMSHTRSAVQSSTTASHSRSPEADPPTRIHDTSSPSSSGASPLLALILSSWKTWKGYSQQNSKETTGTTQRERRWASTSPENWSALATAWRRGCTAREKSSAMMEQEARERCRTGGDGCSSWPSPSARDWKGCYTTMVRKDGRKRGDLLPDAVRLEEDSLRSQPDPESPSTTGSPLELFDWRTPAAVELHYDVEDLRTKDGGPAKSGERAYRKGYEDGNCSSVDLSTQVNFEENWATPNTMDHMDQRSPEALAKQATTTRKGRSKPANLREQVDPVACAVYRDPENWPTATVGDSKAAGSRNTEGSNATPGVSLTDKIRGDGGKGRSGEASRKLNPRWVEALMGLPPGWVCPRPDQPADETSPTRVDELRLLGNGVVPQTFAIAFRELLAYLQAHDRT